MQFDKLLAGAPAAANALSLRDLLFKPNSLRMIELTSITNRVSQALAKLIFERVSLLRAGSSITFDSPAEIVGENSLLLYLYHVGVNPFLRNSPGVLPQRGSGAPVSQKLTPAPAAVDLSYMVVPWGSAEFEQAVAGGVIGALNRCGKIPTEIIDEDEVLKKTGNSDINIVPEEISIHLLRDLWSMFPQRSYRLTMLYKVTPVLLPAEPVDVDLVMQTSLGLQQISETE